MDIAADITGIMVWFSAGFLNGVTSFGGNMFAAPFMTFLMDGKTGIIFTCLAGTPLVVAIAALYARHLRPAELLLLIIPEFAGIPIGSALLGHASPRLLLAGAGMMLLAFTAWQFAMRRIAADALPVWTGVPFGFLSGIALGATGLGGAILGAYAFLRRWDKASAMGMLNTIGAVSMLFCVFVQWRQGLYTPYILAHVPAPAAASVLGVLASVPVLRRIDTHVFRLLMLAMIAVSGAVLLVKSMLMP